MKQLSKLAAANAFSGIALLLSVALAPAAVPVCSAQAASAPAHRVAHRIKPRASTEPDPAPPAVAEAPPKPNWPVNDPPAQPAVTWDATGLQIQAANASLRQILDDVATRTGTKLDGLNKDERIFGTYGPGPAKDVLSQLLHGTGYNVLMLGDVGQGAPREIVLSARNMNAPARSRVSQPNPGQPDDEDQPDQPEEPQPQPIQPQVMQPPNGGPTPGPLHSPEERMQEMQRQQMEMQRQQQQQLQQLQQQQQNQQQ